MSSKVRNCIREVEKKNPTKESLEEFFHQSMLLHNQYARIKLMLEYYMFYEMVSEEINPYMNSVKDIVGELNRIIGGCFEKAPEEAERKKMAEELLSMREEVIARMKVLTAYVDRFVIYEYILNRIQYRFEEKELLPDDQVFAQDLMNFILSGQDSAVVNDNIRVVLGQLPVRMTRTKYYEVIRNSISVYIGSDKSSLDGFLYMFRTNAMLYRDENEGKYFTEFLSVLEELEELDFENLSYELYQIYSEKIRTQAAKLNDISDLYMQIGQLINEMYTLCVTSLYVAEEPLGEMVIRGVYSLFQGEDTDVWEAEGLSDASEEEKLYHLEESFAEIEGKQESFYDSLGLLETALPALLEGQEMLLKETGMRDRFWELKRLFLLISSSVFADLEEKKEEKKVTEDMADRAAAELITDCKEFFKGTGRMVRRAVMANTLEKMPVFFGDAQEIADYIVNSLSQCDDEAEKYAAKQLLMDLMTA